jgi:hypothetical protein
VNKFIKLCKDLGDLRPEIIQSLPIRDLKDESFSEYLEI